ncbi:MAG: GAF domain-containing protein [Cyanobacteria bacterium P01_A01_bin.37]
MSEIPFSIDESLRLQALCQYQILDTDPENGFDDLTNLAANLCHAPIALVSLVDANRQWFKSRVGLDTTETPRNIAFCSYAILQSDILIVPDTLEDERFATNPLVVGAPFIRFYAGVPLITAEGHALGTLCVIDVVPRTLMPKQVQALQALSRQVLAQLELRKKLIESEHLIQEAEEREDALHDEVKERQQAESELQLLLSLTQAVSLAPDFYTALEIVLQQVCEVAGWCYGEVWIKSPDGSFLQSCPPWYYKQVEDNLEFSAALEHFRHQSATLMLNRGEGIPGRVWEQGHLELIPDVSSTSESVFIRTELVKKCRFKAVLGVPILGRESAVTEAQSSPSDRVLAVLVFFAETNQQGGYLIDLVETLSNQLGRVIQQKQTEADLAETTLTLNAFSAHLKQLHRLSTQLYDNFDALFTDYLQTGRQILRCSTGIISQIEGNTYTLLAVQSPLDNLVPNASFALADTYCSEVVRQKHTLAYTHIGASAEMKGHPCYQNLGLETYIGTAIFVNGEIYGTLNFSSSHVRPYEFLPHDLEILELMAQSIGKFIAIHQSESQLQQQAQDLQTALQELKITQAQMVQNEKMSSLGTLVAGIAHEINNPVNFICGNLEYVNQVVQNLMELIGLYQHHIAEPGSEIQEKLRSLDLEFLEQDLPQLFESVQFGTERIQEIVSALRTFSRIDEAELKEIDVHQSLDSTLVLLENRLKEQSEYPTIRVIKDYRDLPLVQCYPGPLNQVFMNILSNAIDALEQKIEQQTYQERIDYPSQITLRTDLIDDRWIEVAIADNGSGISQEIQQQIFDPFFTTKSIGKGTGLGLSISYQIVSERHRGKLACCSNLGTGTEFVIQIPVHQAVYK